MEPANEYLQQVVEEQAKVDRELRRGPGPLAVTQAPAAQPPARGKPGGALAFRRRGSQEAEEDSSGGAQAVDYRITGFWRWQTVVVPPNVYVFHTRRGKPEPLHVGL